MKILVVQESDWIKRNPHQQHHLMELLGLRGHKIRVIDYEIDWKMDKKKGDPRKSERQVYKSYKKVYNTSNITVIRPPLIKIPVINYFSVIYYHRKEIKRQIKEFKPDVIVGFGILNAYIASLLSKIYNIPFVYYFIDELYELIPEKMFRDFGRKVTKLTISNSSYILTINKKLRQTAIELSANKDKTKIISAGINLNHFDVEKINGYKVRQSYNISPTDTVLFFMGFLYDFAGLKELAIELGKNKAKYYNVKLLIVGEGDALKALQIIQSKYNLKNQLILTGQQSYSKIPELIVASDICVLPAYKDEIIMQNIVPIKLYEYMAMKKPIIATRLPGLVTEFGEDNGIIYVDKAEDVLETMKEKLNSKRDITRVGNKGYDFVKYNDWKTLTIKFEKILEGLVLDKLLKE